MLKIKAQLMTGEQHRDLLFPYPPTENSFPWVRTTYPLAQHILALEAENKKLVGRLRGHRRPTHGPCCTCQRCGRGYDECRCDLDDVAGELEVLKADNAAARSAAEGLDTIAINSEGVAGWHKNEAIAGWDEFEDIIALRNFAGGTPPYPACMVVSASEYGALLKKAEAADGLVVAIAEACQRAKEQGDEH